jgi:SSS family solute:Na+ symporter
MTTIDWVILFVYIIFIIALGWWVGRKQKTQDDYYLGGRSMPSWQIALSIMATQVSAISLIGAPAFIALKANGGLVWLQYEFAIPLAMMLIMLILVPMYHRTRTTTIYEYLENRFGRTTRMFISAVFLLSRGLGSGVMLLATAIVTAVCLDWDLSQTILLIGLVAIIYTTFGGIVADIYSDIIQLFILWGGAILTIILIWMNIDSSDLALIFNQPDRLQVFDFQATGLGDGQTFAFWPMLIGGFFLYLSYYGCDQSQAQRLLTTTTDRDAKKSLMINGIFRFPLVLTYSAVGLLLIPFMYANPGFAGRLAGQQPDFLVPYFLIDYMPTGILGLIVAGFFAASMSSIDSALNSLSAASFKDFLVRFNPKLENISDVIQLRYSRYLTIFWGIVATVFALQMVGGSETVLELVNKIGSAFYGPVLAAFWLGMLTKRANEYGVIPGLLLGVGFNIFLWQFYGSEVSWLWWNVFGFIITFVFGLLISSINRKEVSDESLILKFYDLKKFNSTKIFYFVLVFTFIVIIVCSYFIEVLLSSQ